jgi:hypothetical protein
MSLEAKFYICVAFGLGVLLGYLIKKRMKLSLSEFEFQLSRLNSAEITTVCARLQQSWQIPDDVLVPRKPRDTSTDEGNT